jgi:hypothetical protein
MIAAAACVNSAFSYTPTRMTPDGEAFLQCKGQPICINLVEVGGSQNVVDGITQQCGTIQNIKNVISTSPPLAMLTAFLFIVLLVLLSMQSSGKTRGLIPPAPFGASFAAYNT